MNILVLAESGLLIDYYLMQSTHSEYLLRQVEKGLITMAIPEYAYAEADGSLQVRFSQRQQRLQEILAFLNQLLRSRDLEPIAQRIKMDIQKMQTLLADGQNWVKTELMRHRQLWRIIPLQFETYYQGKLRALSSAPPPDEIDCMILESIKSYLKEHRQEYDLILFLCYDRQHFDLPKIHQEITTLGAQLVFSSSECLRIIRENLP